MRLENEIGINTTIVILSGKQNYIFCVKNTQTLLRTNCIIPSTVDEISRTIAMQRYNIFYSFVWYCFMVNLLFKLRLLYFIDSFVKIDQNRMLNSVLRTQKIGYPIKISKIKLRKLSEDIL